MPLDQDVEKASPTRINNSKLTFSRRPYRLYVTDFDKIVAHQYRGEGTVEKPYTVDWLPEDPENPQTWNQVYKWSMTVFVAVATLAVAFCSSAYVGDVQGLLYEFESSVEVVTLGISVYVLGFAIGEFIFLVSQYNLSMF
jgi:hypothetical protein